MIEGKPANHPRPTINLANFTPEELHQLAEIQARVSLEQPREHIRKLMEENTLLRRLLLEAITCILHRRNLNEEARQQIDQILRLDRLPTN